MRDSTGAAAARSRARQRDASGRTAIKAACPAPRLGGYAAEGFLKWHSLCSVHAGHVWRGTDPKDDRKAANQVEMRASQCRIQSQ